MHCGGGEGWSERRGATRRSGPRQSVQGTAEAVPDLRGDALGDKHGAPHTEVPLTGARVGRAPTGASVHGWMDGWIANIQANLPTQPPPLVTELTRAEFLEHQTKDTTYVSIREMLTRETSGGPAQIPRGFEDYLLIGDLFPSSMKYIGQCWPNQSPVDIHW